MSYKIAVEATVTKMGDKANVEDWRMVGSAPWLDNEVEIYDIEEIVADDKKFKALPGGEYLIFFIGAVEYRESYSWEYAVTEVDVEVICEGDVLFWKNYTESDPAPDHNRRAIGRYV